MVFITADTYKNAEVDVIKDNEINDFFWVKMKDVQDGLGLKNIRDKLRRLMQGIFESKSLTKEQIRQYIRTKNEINKNLKDKKIKYRRNDIAEKIIKNCTGVKRS